eukprot:3420952-Prymnesium_polylepis.1
MTRDAGVTDAPRAVSCWFRVGFMTTVSGGGAALKFQGHVSRGSRGSAQLRAAHLSFCCGSEEEDGVVQ